MLGVPPAFLSFGVGFSLVVHSLLGWVLVEPVVELVAAADAVPQPLGY
jgi:hypothetical protein